MQEAERYTWAELFGFRPEEMEVIETHISWVFLGPELVYKLKKPVKFDFLDFSTIEQREQACRDEVRLNQRLSDGVYLDVLPITEAAAGKRELSGEGRPLEWVVKMRRLPQDRTLDQLIARQAVTAEDIEPVVERLAEFYQSLPPAKITAEEYIAHVQAHIQANEAELAKPQHQLPLDVVRRVHRRQLQYLRLWRDEIFVPRVNEGNIVEGHGDLRPEHVCLTDPPAIFDCIEFSREFRTVDVADELAFLANECDFLGAFSLGYDIEGQCLKRMGDNVDSRLSTFYRVYRACVRAKVAAIRAGQHQGAKARFARGEANEYLRQADAFSILFDPQVLLLVSGISGSGKSTLARAIADKLDLVWLRSDQVRRELEGSGECTTRYTRAARQAVYDEMHLRAGELLDHGKSVLLDATYLKTAQRVAARAVASRRWRPSLTIQCVCPLDVAQRRIAERSRHGEDPSEATPELVPRQLASCEVDSDIGRLVEVDTTKPLVAQVERVLAALRDRF